MTMTSVVLRDMRAARSSNPLARPGALGLQAATDGADAPPEPRVDVENVDVDGLHDLSRDPEVVAVTPAIRTRLIEPVAVDDAPASGDAWGITAVGADRSTRTGSGVLVAVLDTGVDASHAAFSGVTVEQKDFSGSGNGDKQGHGTHCAGTILGRDVGGRRIGIARGVPTLLAGKVLGDDGSGSSDALFRGMTWALDEGARVISMSLGFDFPGMVDDLTQGGWPADLAASQALVAYRGNLRMFDALMTMARARQAFDAGALVVAAAGNESKRTVDPDYEIAASLPAASDGVVSVGALQKDAAGFSVASFSNTFPQLSAPGVKILSARAGGGLVEMNGTSMACPHVAGVAALWWEAVEASPLPATAPTVLAKLIASARSDVFAHGVDIADRGVGLVAAP
ncbi:S8 family serine peptidase [Actinomycetospora lutea]|uniref:S8 family peptidase n=1 Tax=Actinomycetospora lutea TaxID=663604 RepID=UPI0023672FAE|nr:S8 family serine peptidase [Actinomycetospora lutea]MDD7942409.1 S8 family serine peptidase [Actinomycetospora lutea]